MKQAIPTLLAETDRVRITEWRFPVGTATGWHRHEHDYVVLPMISGRLTMQSAEGEHAADLVAGTPYVREEGVEHDVINNDDHEIVFVETELLEPAPKKR